MVKNEDLQKNTSTAITSPATDTRASLEDNKLFMKDILIILFLSLSMSSCGQKFSKKEGTSKQCIQFNDLGVKYFLEPSYKKNSLDSAIMYFKQAIGCDSNYITAYVNLAGAFERKHDFKSGLTAYDKILLLSKNYPGFITEKAIILEKSGLKDSANKSYARAVIGYKQTLSVSKNNVDAIKGLIYIKALTLGKDAAIEELNKQIKSHPGIAYKLNAERFFYENFDRQNIN